MKYIYEIRTTKHVFHVERLQSVWKYCPLYNSDGLKTDHWKLYKNPAGRKGGVNI